MWRNKNVQLYILQMNDEWINGSVNGVCKLNIYNAINI